MRHQLGLILAVATMGGSFSGCDSVGAKPVAVDAGPADSGLAEASVMPPTGPYVTNAGDACESTADCTGSMPTCQMDLMIPGFMPGGGGGAGGSIEFPDGYCTATCTSTTEDQCAAGSECGVKKLIETFGPLIASMAGGMLPAGALDQVPSQCLDKCSGTDDCREGYTCQNLVDFSGQASMLPAAAQFFLAALSRYCLPTRAPVDMDAGPGLDASQPVPDASTGDAGSDAGTPDASMPDASTPDAGSDAAVDAG